MVIEFIDVLSTMNLFLLLILIVIVICKVIENLTSSSYSPYDDPLYVYPYKTLVYSPSQKINAPSDVSLYY